MKILRKINIKKEVIYYTPFILLYVVSILWFRGLGSEEFLYIRGAVPTFSSQLPDKFFIWNYKWLGLDGGLGVSGIAWYLPYLFMYSLGFSTKLIQLIIYPIVFILPGITMFWALRRISSLVLTNSKRNKDRILLSSLMGSLLYVLNPFTILFWHAGHYERNVFIFAFSPLFISSLLELGFKKENGYKVGFIWGILFVFVGNALTPLLVAFFGLGLVTLMFVGLVKFGIKFLRPYFQFFTAFIPISLIVNLWWLTPNTMNLMFHAPHFGNVAHGIDYVGLTAEPPGFLQKLMLIVKWTWSASWNGRNFHSFYSVYQSYHLYFFWFPIIIIALMSNLLKIKNETLKFIVIFSNTLLLVSLFLSKGIQPPIGGVFTFMYEHVPFFYMFRNPGHKFGGVIALSFSLLLWSFFFIIGEFKKKRVYKYLPFLTSLCLIIYSWPLLTGVAVREKAEGGMPDNIVSIPAEYIKVADVINSDKKPGKTLLLNNYSSAFLPKGDLNLGYDGVDILGKIVNSPIIHLLPPESRGYKHSIETLEKLYTGENNYMISTLGIKYLVKRDDYMNECEVCQKLIDNPYVQMVEDLEYLDLYKVKDMYFRPLIYPASRSLLDSTQNIAKNDSYKATYVVAKDFIFLESMVGDKNPTINFNAINPTLYKVSVKGATEPFLLNFLTSFNEGWALRLIISDDNTPAMLKKLHSNVLVGAYSSKISSSNKHILINGFGNGWLVKPESICDGGGCSLSDNGYSFDLLIEYRPQKYFLCSLLLSITSVITLTIVYYKVVQRKS